MLVIQVQQKTQYIIYWKILVNADNLIFLLNYKV